jgi:peptide/nickel transport system permease protein
MNLKARNTPPGFLQNGWMGILGTDSLGRSMLARTIVATRNTVGIALAASVSAMVLGGIIGLFAGYVGRWPAKVIMQISDIIQSFPSILLAMIVLYILEPRAANLVIVLAFTRLPVYIRVARSEVLELRERLFVDAARVLGSSSLMILYRHIAPMAAPTVITYWTVDVAFVMLSESGLSFLGIGIQPPEITWGLMVAHGRNYLEIAWWQAFFPGLMIMLSTLSINILSSWVRRIIDPLQRWKFEVQK